MIKKLDHNLNTIQCYQFSTVIDDVTDFSQIWGFGLLPPTVGERKLNTDERVDLELSQGLAYSSFMVSNIGFLRRHQLRELTVVDLHESISEYNSVYLLSTAGKRMGITDNTYRTVMAVKPEFVKPELVQYASANWTLRG